MDFIVFKRPNFFSTKNIDSEAKKAMIKILENNESSGVITSNDSKKKSVHYIKDENKEILYAFITDSNQNVEEILKNAPESINSTMFLGKSKLFFYLYYSE